MSTRSSRELMNKVTDVETGDSALVQRRRVFRYFAAAMSAATAVMYFLIGFRVVAVLDNVADQQLFGIVAGAGYALGVVLLLAFDYRVISILGAILQALVIYTYFNLAPQRTPSYEVWGILIRIAQLIILVTLVYLEVRLPLPRKVEPRESEP